jgi:two-component system, sensor histidine kinase PdtaS
MMGLKKWFLLLFSICFLSSYCFAQKTNGSLGYAKFSEFSLSDLLTKLGAANKDTAKANLLLKISSIYCGKMPHGRIESDSALYFGREALLLSKELAYTPGVLEASFIICKRSLQNSAIKDAREVLKTAYGEQRARLLIVMAEHYTFLPGALPENLALAYPYIKEAKDISDTIHSIYWRNQSLNLLGKYYFIKGDFNAGENSYLEIINYFKHTGDKLGEADWWSELYHYMPDNDSTYSKEIRCATNAMNIYQQLHRVRDLAYTLDDMAQIHKWNNKLELAIQLELKAIQLLKDDKVVKFFNQYARLSEIYLSRGDFNKALYYALESQKNAEMLKQPLGLNYKLIGDIYRQMGDPANSIKYYKMSLASNENFVSDHYTFMTIRYISQGLIEIGKSKQGLAFITDFINKYPPGKFSDREIVACAFGDCYNALKNFRAAEKYYLEMIRLHDLTQKDRMRQIFVTAEIGNQEAFYTISKFYTDQKRFKEAIPYIKKVQSFPLSPIMQKNTKAIQTKIDSAAGDYRAALMDFQRATSLKDSIFSVARNTELTMLKVQFETEQKEKNIQLLEKEDQLQKRKIEQADQTKKVTYGGVIMLLIILVIVYNRYLLKQKSNLQLKVQQATINKKNESLVQLVNEKEWLLREVHHRVKNNLQLVMSLLQSQFAYLKDESALSAVLESQNRVQAMSLIHQKLYKSENLSTIYMPEYIYDLVDYLRESFKTKNAVYFDLKVDQIKLDVTKAVPLGLILNEIITNSLKHAFPNTNNDTVSVELYSSENNLITLAVTDNGHGFPPDFDMTESNSFGMILMKGLTNELSGTFTMNSDQNGTMTMITFTNLPIIFEEVSNATQALM